MKRTAICLADQIRAMAVLEPADRATSMTLLGMLHPHEPRHDASGPEADISLQEASPSLPVAAPPDLPEEVPLPEPPGKP
uniref:hypothetical protein n=1 Tax=Caballeronia sp. INML3 TaxID=2921752 RepID=UPI002032694E